MNTLFDFVVDGSKNPRKTDSKHSISEQYRGKRLSNEQQRKANIERNAKYEEKV